MSAKPSQVPTWATDANYTSGPEAGTPTKVEPTSGRKAQGFQPNTKPTAQELDWQLNLIGQWAQYLNDGAWTGDVTITGNLHVTGNLTLDGHLAHPEYPYAQGFEGFFTTAGTATGFAVASNVAHLTLQSGCTIMIPLRHPARQGFDHLTKLEVVGTQDSSPTFTIIANDGSLPPAATAVYTSGSGFTLTSASSGGFTRWTLALTVDTSGLSATSRFYLKLAMNAVSAMDFHDLTVYYAAA